MSDNVKNNEYLNELIRYKNNKMSNQEMHQLEEALERDPFLAEALEGFSDFKSSDIEKDLASIDLISGKKKFRINTKVFLSVAASIAVLVIAFFVYRGIDRSNQLASNEPKESEPANLLADTVFEPAEVDSTIYEQVDTVNLLFAEAEKTKSVTGNQERKMVDEPVKQKKVASEPVKSNALLKDSTVKKERKGNERVPMVALKAEEDSSFTLANPQKPKAKLQQTEMVEQKLFETMDEPSDLEVTVSPEKESDEEGRTAVREGVNARPEPLGGFDLFKDYIDKNMNYPSSAENGSREVVRVRFTVAANGELANFSIDKAPDNSAFSEEAIRLLRSGPKWSPGVKDGVPVEEEVSYRFVFKPSNQ